MTTPGDLMHLHDFGTADVGVVRMCAVDGCAVLHAHTAEGWVPLTATQQSEATMIMWEDLIMVKAMQLIHGKERGLAHYREMAGYDQTLGGP
jgi:hypothetical protein